MAILIIEDEKKLVDLLKRALKSERYSVDAAYDGVTGLEKAIKNNYIRWIIDFLSNSSVSNPEYDNFFGFNQLI